jgi:hypothetical protein
MNRAARSGNRARPAWRGLRWRKQVRLRRWAAVNLSRSGMSLTVGRRGLNVNLSRRGLFVTLGLPGSGFSYRWGVSWARLARAGYAWLAWALARNRPLTAGDASAAQPGGARPKPGTSQSADGAGLEVDDERAAT